MIVEASDVLRSRQMDRPIGGASAKNVLLLNLFVSQTDQVSELGV